MFTTRSLHHIVDKKDCNLEKIKKFLEKFPSTVNEPNPFGETALYRMLARKNCTADIVKLFLKFGADVNYKNKMGESSLNTAIEMCGDEDVIRVLVENGADINILSGLGQQSALCFALKKGASKSIIELLLDKGCSPTACFLHSTILHCAVNFPDPGPKEDVFHMLFERGFDVKAVDKHGQTVLCSALRSETRASTIQLLLAAGASFSTCSEHFSPLLCATDEVMWGLRLRAEVFELILESDACMDRSVIEDCLYDALDRCNFETETIRLLLGRLEGTDLCSMESFMYCNNSLLHMAADTPCSEPSIVELLIEHGLQVNKLNGKGETPLHVAVGFRQCRPDMIKALLENGAEVNRTDSSGQTPLSIAVGTRVSAAVLKELLAAGALIRARHGRSLLDEVAGVMHIMSLGRERGGVPKEELKKSLICFKLLLRYYFLETSEFNVDYLFQNRSDCKALVRFKNGCKRELQRMKSKYVGEDLTLHEFLSQSASDQFNLLMNLNSCKLPEKKYNFDQLLKTLADAAFPLYFGVISAKVGRSSLLKKLQEVPVYAEKRCLDLPFILQESILDYKSLCSIAEHLEDEELLRLILAFCNVSDRPCADQASTAKRSATATEQCCKHPKLLS